MSRNYYRHLIGGAAPAPTGLFTNAVAYYKLDETSGQAIDVINGYNGDLFNGVTQGLAGKIGNAYGFDGTSGYINYGKQPAFNFSDGLGNDIPFTMRLWINPNDVSGIHWLFSKDDFINPHREFIWQLRDGGIFKINFIHGSANIPYLDINFNASIKINQWQHIVLTYDGSKSSSGVKCYVDNVEVNQTTSLHTFDGFVNGNANFRFSSFIGDSKFYSGIADEQVIIKNEAWTPAQVAADYNNGLGTTI